MKLAETPYWEGQGDLVSRLIMGVNWVSMWLTGVITLQVTPEFSFCLV